MKAVYRSFYNFFHMFKKDSGAHFTYNLGVGMLRLGLLFVLWALIIAAEWFFLSSPRFVYEFSATTLTVNVEKHGGDLYTAEFEVRPKDGQYFRYTEYITGNVAEALEYNTYEDELFHIYKLVGRGIEHGRDYGRYISHNSSVIAEWQYYMATPDARPPVQTWGIWVSLICSAVLFAIGRRQIRLSMKYPRSDVPLDVSGAPVPVYGEEYFRARAAEAVREDMLERARKMLTSDDSEGVTEDDTETLP